MTNVLVLGGTSWLGGEIAKVALDRGLNVTCLARGEAGEAPAGATFVQADRESPHAYDAVKDTPWDHVFDVSWQPRFVRGAVEVLGPASSHWTYVSSCSIYADQSVGGDEDAPLAAPLENDSADWSTYSGAKAVCEQLVQTLPRTFIARAGLLGGPGDRSDRFGYWVSRFALAEGGPVLVPDIPGQPTQTLSVNDLANWLVDESVRGLTGVFNAVGEQLPFDRVLIASAQAAGFAGELVPVSAQWMAEHDIRPWSGPTSMPLWTPGEEGMGMRDDARATAAGLTRRTLSQLAIETLDFERSRGLDRERRAGLTREEELGLIAQWSAESTHDGAQ